MGTASGWLKLREGNQILSRHISQILDTLDGTDPGRPITLKKSDGAVTLLTVSDSGVAVSPDGVLQASNFFIYPKMCVFWKDVAANVPPNFEILADAQDRFPWAANVDGDVGDTGGSNDHTHTGPSHTHAISATHTHTGPSHTHTSASHSHDLSAHTHDGASHSHDLSAHTHSGGSHSHDLSDHHHNVNESPDGQQVASGADVTVATRDHDHGDTDGPDTDATSSDSFGTTSGPSVDATSSDAPGASSGPSTDSTSSDTPGATGASGTGVTGATAPGTTDAAGTGNTGSSSQQPPVAYWRGYLIERQ